MSFTISWSLLKLVSIESMMSSNHLIPCLPLFLLPSIFPSIRVFSFPYSLPATLPISGIKKKNYPELPFSLGFPCGSTSKESACNVGDLCSIPGWKDPLEKATHSKGYPLQHSGLENSIDYIVHGFAKSQT